MQSLINDKGYIEASEMKELTKNLDTSKKLELPSKFALAKPKKLAGGGDRERVETNNSNKRKTPATTTGELKQLHNPQLEFNLHDDRASVVTIYQQAVRNKIGKRMSSSLEEGELINTSDEIEPMETEQDDF